MRHLLTLLSVAGLTVLLAACGSSDESDGDVTISGSSTVQPLVSRLAGNFVSENPRARFDLEAPGTGEGFLLFCDGLTDINNASWPIAPVERRACRANGVEYVELEIARDAAVVAMSEREKLPECLSLAQLFSLTGPTASATDTWDGIGPSSQVPQGNFELVAPSSSSGTSEVFIDLVISDRAELRAQPAELRRDTLSVASDQLVGDVVRESPGTMGVLGYTVASTEAGIRLIDIADTGGCIAPGRDSIEAGTYPLIRSLFMYVNTERAGENPTLRSFVESVIDEDLGEVVADAGSIPVPGSVSESNQAAWSDGGQ